MKFFYVFVMWNDRERTKHGAEYTNQHINYFNLIDRRLIIIAIYIRNIRTIINCGYTQNGIGYANICVSRYANDTRKFDGRMLLSRLIIHQQGNVHKWTKL